MRDDYQSRPKARFSSALNGVLLAQAIWVLSVVATHLGADFFAIIAFPIGVISWGIWGDNIWPAWTKSASLHISFGLCFYGLIGSLIGWCLNRPIRFSLRTLLVATTLIAVALGLLAISN